MKKIDRNLLKQITAKSLANQSTGVKKLINSIHKEPKLRDWVTLESMALPPIPVKKGNQYHLFTLLVTTKNDNRHDRVLNSPWALIEWVLPQGNIVQFQEIRNNPQIDRLKLNYTDEIKNNPSDRKINNDTKIKIQRENILYQLLDRLDSDSNDDLTYLAPHYSGLLPQEIYQFYWLLIPECQSWLNPNIPALRLDTAFEEENQKIITETNKHPQKLENKGLKPSLQNNQKIVTQTNESDNNSKLNQKLTPKIKVVEIESKVENRSLNNEPETSKIDLNLPSLVLTTELKTWLSQLQLIADSFGIATISKQLHSYEHRLSQPGFKLAMVGEFSRGKSSLINELLGEKILPVGNLPTTSTLISIVAKEENSMEVYLPNQPVEVRELNEQSWLDLLATNPTGNNKNVLAAVRVNLKHFLLKKLDVELIDTPGAGDLSAQRAAIVFDLLNRCDATVLVISATMALSLTEIAFLEQEIIGRHVPRILVVVTKLDLVKPEERATVFASITDRLSKISTQIPVVSLHPITEENQSAQEAIDLIKTEIEKLVDRKERQIWQNYQIANQLLDYSCQLKDFAQKTIKTMQLEQAQREKQIKQQQKQIKSTSVYWEKIELELETRRIKRYQDLDNKVNEIQNNVIETLQFQLKKVNNPKSWWQDDVPFILRKELVTFSRNIENYLTQKIAQDYSWLEETVKQEFQQKINTVGSSAFYPIQTKTDNIKTIADWQDLPLNDLQKYRLLTRLGSSAAIIVGYVLGGPIGIVGSTGVWLFGENMMNKTIEQQKASIEQELELKINQCFQEYSRKIDDRLQKVYQELIQSVQKNQQFWLQNQQTLIKKIDSPDFQIDRETWLKSINELETLEKDISQQLNHNFYEESKIITS